MNYISKLGGTSAYSGRTKTLYINDPLKNDEIQSIESAVLIKFGFDLPFKLQTN